MLCWEHVGLEMTTAARPHFHSSTFNLLCTGYKMGPGSAAPIQGLAEPIVPRLRALPVFILSVLHDSLFYQPKFSFLLYTIFPLQQLQKAVPSLQPSYTEWPTPLWLFLASTTHCPSHLLNSTLDLFFPKMDDENCPWLFRWKFSCSLYSGRSSSSSFLEAACPINPMISFGFCVQF